GTTGGTTGALDCGDADVALILASFELCDNPPQQVGQSASAPGVTCEQVCCAMGFESCVYRAAQADYDACNPPNANQSGSCADVFQPAWSSQCLCS
ncbi:MAG: hypothetical protein KC468_36505, partial [Myxococcales bacterium]|nr:hypothetical protein [Myxococcales bacterium]